MWYRVQANLGPGSSEIRNADPWPQALQGIAGRCEVNAAPAVSVVRGDNPVAVRDSVSAPRTSPHVATPVDHRTVNA